MLGIGLVGILCAGCHGKEITSAKVYIQQNNWEQAIAQLEKAVAENPRNPEAQFLLGQGYARHGRFADMNRAFAASLSVSSKFEIEIKGWQRKYFAENFNAGLKAASEKDFETAQEFLLTAKLIDPAQPDTYKNLAMVYAQQGQHEEALTQYCALLEIKPDDVDAYLGIAGLHNQRREYEKSVEALQQALAKHPDLPALLVELAVAYDCLGEREKAFENYQRALQLKPDDKDLLLDLGRMHLADANYSKAVELFNKVLIIYPDHFEATYNTGVCYLKIGERLDKEANDLEEQLAKRLEVSTQEKAGQTQRPEDSRIARLHATAQANFKTAMPYLLKAVELDPGHAGAWFNLGVGYTRIGDAEKAKEAFRKSEELAGN
jgi:tetratricopeptide (TPR) repeat protein